MKELIKFNVEEFISLIQTNTDQFKVEYEQLLNQLKSNDQVFFSGEDATKAELTTGDVFCLTFPNKHNAPKDTICVVSEENPFAEFGVVSIFEYMAELTP